jgi:hypothetical protein
MYISFFRLSILGKSRIYHITFIHTWAVIFWSTSWMEPSQSRSGERPPFLPHVGAMVPLPPYLACPGFCYQQVVCSMVHLSHIQSPYNCTHVLTLIYKLTSWVCDTTYKFYTYTILQFFFLFFNLTSKQVSWPRTLMLGTRSRLPFLILEVGMYPIVSLTGTGVGMRPN